jgi:hypothetical protein
MSLLCKGTYYSGNLLLKGISRLSQLTIDADKDWVSQGLSNIGRANQNNLSHEFGR